MNLIICAAALAAAAFSGCGSTDIAPSAGLGDPYPPPLSDPRISVLAPDLQQWLSFHPAAVVNDGERPMQVDVPVRNLSDQLYLIDYRILFYDDNGLQLEPGMNWRMEALRGKQTVRLRARALSSDADSYRLEVKWAG